MVLQDDYSALTPDVLLDALESLNLTPEPALLALNSYENRVYQFRTIDEDKFVIKVYRPQRWTIEQIKEEHQFSFALAERDIPVVCPLKLNEQTVHEFNGYLYSVFPNQPGRVIDLEQLEQLKWVGRLLARIHQCGELESFEHRVHINIETFGYQPFSILEKCPQIPLALKSNFLTGVEHVLRSCENYQPILKELKTLRIHGDCHQGNILWTEAGPHFVDLDDCMMGPAVQDLWMLVSGQDADRQRQWSALLEGYETFRDLDPRELHSVECLRALRMINYIAWLAKRWNDPSFPHHFPWFDSERYWESQILAFKEQLAILQEPPLISLI